MNKQLYFLGGATPSGFKSKFIEQIKKPGYFTYILKGGPGTGKSTLMKKIAEEFKDLNISLYYCSSDTRSLDAVVIEDKGIIIVDGTAPHVFETLYPGACQDLVNLGDCWDRNKIIAHKDAIKYCFDENQKYHARTRCYIEALASLNSDIYSIAESCLNKKKLSAYIKRLIKKLLPKNANPSEGNIEFRQLSAFTADNYMTMPAYNGKTVYFIKDDIFAGGDFFLKYLTEHLYKTGHKIIVSECNMLHNSTYEHIIIEDLNLAFITGNFFNKIKIDDSNIINFTRFYDKDVLALKKHRIAFDKKASLELAQEASLSINTALEIHDELEKFYIDAIDFDSLNSKTENIINEIKKL